MSLNKEHSNAQLIPSYTEELVPLFEYPDLVPISRVSLVSLIDRIGDSVKFGSEPSIGDYERAEPYFIEKGLYVPRFNRDNSGRPNQHVVYTGVKDNHEPDPRNKDKRDYGVAFQPAEFKIIARSPSDLAVHAVVAARNARWQQPDRDQDSKGSMRAGGHILEDKIKGLDKILQRLQGENDIFRHLIKHLGNPDKYRTRVNKLDKERAFGVEKIHDTVEVASIYLSLPNTSIVGLHKVIKKRIYNGNYSHAERSAHLSGYLYMVGLHNRAKMHKADISKLRSKHELESNYQSYLDAERERSDVQSA
jgi:hypothetical protein